MPWYKFAEWSEWPIEDVEDYANELVEHFCLSQREADGLLFNMKMRCKGFYSCRKMRHGPIVIDQRTIDLLSEIEVSENGGLAPNGDRLKELIWNECERLNRPFEPPPMDDYSFSVRNIGDGLSARQKIQRHGKGWKRDEISKKWKKNHASYPREAFRFVRRDAQHRMENILWESGYLTYDNANWLCPAGHDEPYSGMYWYYKEVCELLHKADRRRKQRLEAEAMELSFQAGTLFSEMQLKATHDELFRKAQSTRQSQSDGGAKRRKLRDPELAKVTWWKYRNQGYKKADAGREAARELGLSEPTIRRSFEGKGYPE